MAWTSIKGPKNRLSTKKVREFLISITKLTKPRFYLVGILPSFNYHIIESLLSFWQC